MHFARRRRQSRHFFPDKEGTIASKSNTTSLLRAFCPYNMYLDWSWTLLTRPAPVHRGPQPRHSVDGFFLLEQLVDGIKCRCLFPSVGILVNVH